MKSVMAIMFVLIIGIAATAWAGGSVENGKAIVKSKHCALCHRQGGIAHPLASLATNKTDAFLKGAITTPKKTLGPTISMPTFPLPDAQVQDVISYLRSLSKH